MRPQENKYHLKANFYVCPRDKKLIVKKIPRKNYYVGLSLNLPN